MSRQKFIPTRRNFISQSLTLGLSFAALPSIAWASGLGDMSSTDKDPALKAELVHQFVLNAHGNFAQVKEMLAKEPMLVNACWDWGGGDFELAIGGAAHMGNRDIANYLLDNNARIDIFSAAMLGYKAVVESLIKMKPAIANVEGPHQFPLLYHVAISGDTDMARLVIPHVKKERIAADCNLSLQAAARDGHVQMIEWLFANGVDNPNDADVLGRSALKIAEEKGHKEAAKALKKHGAK